MTEPAVRNVRLYGILGAKFGRCFRLAVASPAEAVQALSNQLPGFSEYLINSKDRGIGYAVFIGKENISKEELVMNSSEKDIRIAPVMLGSKKNGVMQIIMGIVLVVVGVVYGYVTGDWPGAWQYFIASGIAMIAGGLVQLLTPVPKGKSARDKGDDEPSYYFNGSVNTTAQGHPTPLLYGRKKIGSAVISASITTADHSVVPVDTGSIIGGGSIGDISRYIIGAL